jgi:ABC-type transport system involved in cytochrome bd biosynthesis fused ATPase/permease subunit
MEKESYGYAIVAVTHKTHSVKGFDRMVIMEHAKILEVSNSSDFEASIMGLDFMFRHLNLSI